MHRVSAHDAKARFGQLLDTARREPVVIAQARRTDQGSVRCHEEARLALTHDAEELGLDRIGMRVIALTAASFGH